MAKGPQNEASIPNPALTAFGVLVGAWNTVGTHPLVPGTTFHGIPSEHTRSFPARHFMVTPLSSGLREELS